MAVVGEGWSGKKDLGLVGTHEKMNYERNISENLRSEAKGGEERRR